MKVFISWSGQRSMAVAKILSSWLPQIMNEVQTFVSDDDIAKGGFWNASIMEELNASSFGVVCVTPENVGSNWMLFESGALSKQVNHSITRVAPLLVGFGPQLLPPGHPLGGFQVTKPVRDDMRKLVDSINASLAVPRDTISLERAFAVWWPQFEEEFHDIPTPGEAKNPTPVSDTDLLRELTQMVQNLTQAVERISSALPGVKSSQWWIETSDAINRADDGIPLVLEDLIPDDKGRPMYVMAIGNKRGIRVLDARLGESGRDVIWRVKRPLSEAAQRHIAAFATELRRRGIVNTVEYAD